MGVFISFLEMIFDYAKLLLCYEFYVGIFFFYFKGGRCLFGLFLDDDGTFLRF
jgi:hypothetical protein